MIKERLLATRKKEKIMMKKKNRMKQTVNVLSVHTQTVRPLNVVLMGLYLCPVQTHPHITSLFSILIYSSRMYNFAILCILVIFTMRVTSAYYKDNGANINVFEGLRYVNPFFTRVAPIHRE